MPEALAAFADGDDALGITIPSDVADWAGDDGVGAFCVFGAYAVPYLNLA